MDSSDLTNYSSGSMPNDIVDNSSMITFSKRDIFLSTYRRQNFTLPDSIMHYFAKNPKNSEIYEKMIKRCKYFFIKNPILILSYFLYSGNGWQFYIDGKGWKKFDMKNCSSKLWITDKFCNNSWNYYNKIIASSIIPKIYRYDLKRLFLENQVIFYHKFVILCSSVKELVVEQVTVNYKDGTVVPFEKLVEQLPNVKKFEFAFSTPSNDTSKNTFKELWKIPHLSNYDVFFLDQIPEDFDIDSFYSFMKKNQSTEVYLEFSATISEAYKIRLEAVIDEIIATENHEYKPPYIEFPGLDEEKFDKLRDIFYRCRYFCNR